ncbi:hypothetical protein QL285_028657 [Trifolium repens]|nr:hypothetical protein QL285_028657 [Trifolium repens]
MEQKPLMEQSPAIRFDLSWEEENLLGEDPTLIKNLNRSSVGDNMPMVPLVDKKLPFVNQTRTFFYWRGAVIMPFCLPFIENP